jgi:3-oxoadipate enol-lactonase
MPETKINGIKLYYEVSGRDDGPVLLLSNSLGTTLDMWWPQMDALGARCRIVRYDSRGHGRSDAPDTEYTMEQLGRDALGLLDYLEIDQASLCGVSKGGMVGMWLGANAPARIEKLVLANTSAYLGQPEAWQQRIDLVRREGMAALAPIILERWFTQAFRERCPGDVQRLQNAILSIKAAGYAGCCAAIRDMDQRPALASIEAPTLVIGGLSDPATPPEHTQYLADSIAGARLVNLDAAHISNIEQPDEFTRAVLEFL